MKKLKKWRFVIIGAILLLPFALNFIIVRPQCSNMSVVGTATDWLSFWGSYLGCVLSVFASLIILYQTIKTTQQQYAIDLYHKELLYFHDDIKDRFSKYNIAEVIKFSEYISPQKEQIAEETVRLQYLHEKYSSLFYSAQLLYMQLDNADNGAFLESYKYMISKSVELINDVFRFLSIRIGNWSGDWSEDEKNIIMGFSEKVEALSRFNTDIVFSKAENIMKYMNETFNEMQRYNNVYNEDFNRFVNKKYGCSQRTKTKKSKKEKKLKMKAKISITKADLEDHFFKLVEKEVAGFKGRDLDAYIIQLAFFENEETASLMKESLEKRFRDLDKGLQVFCQLEYVETEEERNCWLLSARIGYFVPIHGNRYQTNTTEYVNVNESGIVPDLFFIDKNIHN